MQISLTFKDLSEISHIASQIISYGKNHNVWLFDGAMAAGKTTLIKEICKQLGVGEQVSSPTYSLVNEYITADEKVIYHFDFYRLKSEMEALDYGIEEYFYSENLCLCEWPSIIPSLWPEKYMLVEIFVNENSTRNLAVSFKP